jgi:hypothetical protein
VRRHRMVGRAVDRARRRDSKRRATRRLVANGLAA